MLLAEALAARKDAISEIDNLGNRLAAAALRYEDEDATGEPPAEIVSRLTNVLERFELLTVQINRTNSETSLSFDGRQLSVMEAIALRARLTMEAKARRMAVDAVEQVSGKGGRARGWLGSRRTKDDVRELPTVDLREERHAADQISETLRRLDLALQQRNWTTDLRE